MTKFAKTINGPVGSFRIDFQDDNVWSVEHIIVDDRPNGPIGSQFVGTYQTRVEALKSAMFHAYGAWPGQLQIPDPLPDRRGLVAHSRELYV
jgi:hypothetical protein